MGKPLLWPKELENPELSEIIIKNGGPRGAVFVGGIATYQQIYDFNRTHYWGLVRLARTGTKQTYYKVRIWRNRTGEGYDWNLLPQRRRGIDQGDTAIGTAFWFEYEKDGKYYWRPYPRDIGVDYYEILSDAEIAAVLSIGGSQSTTVVTGNPSAETLPRPSSSNYISADRLDETNRLLYLDNFPPSSTGTGTRGTRGGGGQSGYAPPPVPRPETKIVIRMPNGYATPTRPPGSSRPSITQFYYDSSAVATGNQQEVDKRSETFYFPYIPNNIRYSDIGSEWTEIPRSQNVAYLDWNRYKLLKVSMQFVVANEFYPGSVSGGQVGDGLMSDVDGMLQMLQRMATRKNPVIVNNFDDILSTQMRRGRDIPAGMEFVISDLSITATRRTTDFNTGNPTFPSKIAAAQVDITFQEVPVETVTIVRLPPLQVPFDFGGGGDDGGGGGGSVVGLLSQTATFVSGIGSVNRAQNSLATPPGPS